MKKQKKGNKLIMKFDDIRELLEHSFEKNYHKESVESFNSKNLSIDISEYNIYKNSVKKNLIEKKIMKESDFGIQDTSDIDYVDSYVGTGFNVGAFANGNPKFRYRKKRYSEDKVYKLYLNIVYPSSVKSEDISKMVSYVIATVNYLSIIGVSIELYGSICSRGGVIGKSFSDVIITYPIETMNTYAGIDIEHSMKYLSGEFFRSHIFNILMGIDGMERDLGMSGEEEHMLNIRYMKNEEDIIDYITKDFKLFLA